MIPILIETDGDEWGVSTDGTPNPTAENYIAVKSAAIGAALIELIGSYEMQEAAAAFFTRGEELNCPQWGKQASGHLGPCGNCPTCRIATLTN